jgi:hypothetical protein
VISFGEAMKTLAEHHAESDLSKFEFWHVEENWRRAKENFAMKITKTLSRAKSTNPPQAEQVRSNQSSGQIFGLAVTAVFFVMLILNAISY